MKSSSLVGLLVVAALAFLAMKRHTFNFGPQPTTFNTEALANQVTDLEDNRSNVQAVLDQYKGETIIIDVWASWCGDCIKGLPKVVKMQEATAGQKINYLFLSVDKDKGRWKRAVKKHDIKGDHYLLDGAWDSAFGDFLNLDWIPRYLVVNPAGEITLYKATSADDPDILKTAQQP